MLIKPLPMLLQVFSLPLKNPVLIFSLILFIILLTPVLLQRLRIPDLIGLIIAGAVIGPNGVGIMERDSSIELFGTVGLLYIMFIAGLEIDMADLKKNYDNLDVHFEKWLGESDADPYIPPMVEDMKKRGIAVPSEGAWVIPVAQEGDKKEMPPCILVKSDGSSIYATTDLATLVQRMQDWHPDKVLYVTDKRQNLHFEQVFRAARKAGIVPDTTELEHVGFGTMNGKDGKPFKTRDGGVLRLETLISDMTDFVRAKVVENRIVEPEEVEPTTAKIAMAALKYGDLSNQPTKDYNFDMERFAAFEGNTGPYILYTIVRIKSILSRYGAWENLPIQEPANDYAKDLMLAITKFGPALEGALKTSSPNLICAYVYELAGCVNKFYHETPILKEEDETVKAGHIALIGLAKNILEASIDLLGFHAPEKM